MMFTVQLSGAAHQQRHCGSEWLAQPIKRLHPKHQLPTCRDMEPHSAQGRVRIPRRLISEWICKFRQRQATESRIEDTTLMVNELYISVVFRPNPVSITKVVNMFSRPSKKELMERQHEGIEMMEDLIATTVTALDRYDPTLLGCYEHKGNHFSGTCEFLKLHPERNVAALPRAGIRDTLPTSRPFFGKGGLMSLRTPTNDYFVRPWLSRIPLSRPRRVCSTICYLFRLNSHSDSRSHSCQKPAARGRMTRQQKR